MLKVRDVFSTLYVGWGEGQVTCTLHLVRIFGLVVFKEPQVHNNYYYCFKIFVHDCRFKKRNRGSCLNLIQGVEQLKQAGKSLNCELKKLWYKVKNEKK